jgi:hypothetical protein
MTQSIETSAAVAGRRGFLKTGAAAVAAFAASGLLMPGKSLAVSPALTFANVPGTGDVKVLNYALALESLESDLYGQAWMRLTKGGTNLKGTKITGLNVDTDQPDVRYVIQFLEIEKQHRNFIDTALGSASLLRKAPFNKVRYDFGMQSKTRKQVMDLVYLAEQTGVGAYLGAIPFFTTRTYLQTAGAILGTEARHTAVIADVLVDLFGESKTVAPLANSNAGRDVPISPDAVLAAVSPFISFAS